MISLSSDEATILAQELDQRIEDLRECEQTPDTRKRTMLLERLAGELTAEAEREREREAASR